MHACCTLYRKVYKLLWNICNSLEATSMLQHLSVTHGRTHTWLSLHYTETKNVSYATFTVALLDNYKFE